VNQREKGSGGFTGAEKDLERRVPINKKGKKKKREGREEREVKGK